MSTDYTTDYAAEFRRLRELADLSIKDCARELAVSPAFISRLENGEYTDNTVIIWESRLLLNKDIKKHINNNLSALNKIFYKRPENLTVEELEERIKQAQAEQKTLQDCINNIRRKEREAEEDRQRAEELKGYWLEQFENYVKEFGDLEDLGNWED